MEFSIKLTAETVALPEPNNTEVKPGSMEKNNRPNEQQDLPSSMQDYGQSFEENLRHWGIELN